MALERQKNEIKRRIENGKTNFENLKREICDTNRRSEESSRLMSQYKKRVEKMRGKVVIATKQLEIAYAEMEKIAFHHIEKLGKFKQKRIAVETRCGEFVLEIQQCKDSERNIEEKLEHISEAIYEQEQNALANLRHEKHIEACEVEWRKWALTQRREKQKLKSELDRIQGKVNEQIDLSCELEEERLRCRTVKIADVKVRAFRKLQKAVVRQLDINAELWKKIEEEQRIICEKKKEEAISIEQTEIDSDDLADAQKMILGRQAERHRKMSGLERCCIVKESELKGKIVLEKAKISGRKERLEAKRENMRRACGGGNWGKDAVMMNRILKELAAEELEWKLRRENTRRAVRHFKEFYRKVTDAVRRFGFADYPSTQGSLLCEWNQAIDYRNLDLRIIG
jgi:hypothetical protein